MRKTGEDLLRECRRRPKRKCKLKKELSSNQRRGKRGGMKRNKTVGVQDKAMNMSLTTTATKPIMVGGL
jgi:hypothetical protein